MPSKSILERRDALSSQKLWLGAADYCDAAKLLHRHSAGTPLFGSHPFWFCACQSAELAFKAFLRGAGAQKRDLMRLKHDLGATLDDAKKADLRNWVELSAAEEAELRAVGVLYAKKAFQYAETGWTTLPYAHQFLTTVNRLVAAIEPYARERRTTHHGKPTAVQE